MRSERDDMLTGKKRFRRVKHWWRRSYFIIEVEVHRIELYFTPCYDDVDVDYGHTAIVDSYFWRPLRVEDLEIPTVETTLTGDVIC